MDATTYDVFCDWLQKQQDAEIIFVQEIHWGLGKTESSWRIGSWHAFVSPDPRHRYAGVAIFVSSKVAEANQVAYHSIIPGRILHVRCVKPRVTLDLIAGYQHVWQAGKKDVVTKQRHTFWNKLGKLLHDLPVRNLLLMGMDLNSGIKPLPGLIGVNAQILRELEAADARGLRAIARLILQRRCSNVVDLQLKELHLTPEGIPGVACPDCGITFVNRFLRCMSVMDVDESDRAAVAQREMELLGLNSLPSRAGPMQASQDDWQKWEDQLQSKNWGADEPSKWRKAESKGTGRSYGGWGPKRKTPEQEEKEKALDKETQQLLQLMTRMTLRHEKELSRLRADTSFVMFCDVGDHGCLPQLKATAENWQEQYAAQKVTTSLKIIMMLSLLKALRNKMDQVTTDQEITEKYKTLAWLSEGANALAPCWNYLKWNSTEKKEQVASVPPIKHQEVLTILDKLEQAVPQPGILTDFRNTKGMDGKPSEVVPFLISIGLRQAATAEVHAGLQKVSGCSCMKLVACRLRPDRGQRPQLAKQIEEAFKATTYCDWGGDGGISTGECLRLPIFAEPQGTALPQFDSRMHKCDYFHQCTPAAAIGRHCVVQLLSLPHDVYADMLECHLLLSCYAALMRQQDIQPCERLGMMARNDLSVYAKEELDRASYEAFVEYSIQLSERVGARISAITPPPLSLPSQHHSQAEILAWQFLTNGGGSVGEAVRLVASMLRFEQPRQRMMQSDAQASSFHLGICARGALVGVCKDTLTHRNVCRLLCFHH
ncbi:unnamed protein product [Symbiodinium microadriaticum]|nr:unnamed protein product [Symbiodinium microadriaticum]